MQIARDLLFDFGVRLSAVVNLARLGVRRQLLSTEHDRRLSTDVLYCLAHSGGSGVCDGQTGSLIGREWVWLVGEVIL